VAEKAAALILGETHEVAEGVSFYRHEVTDHRSQGRPVICDLSPVTWPVETADS